MSSTFRITRSTEIAAPPERVRALIDDFHEWQKWSPWEDLDPEMTRDYGGAASGVGATYAWSGNRRAGEGRMEVLESSTQHLGVELEFAAPMRARNRLDFTLTATGNGTNVEWVMTGPQNTVMRLMSRFWSMEKLVGPDFERGLGRLKSVAEAS